MGLIDQETSLAQRTANRANSRLSTGPRTALGKTNSSRNLHKASTLPLKFDLEELNEKPRQLEKLHRNLIESLEPRDAFEDTLVQSIALLQFRLRRLYRAEVGVITANKIHLRNQRRLKGLHRAGVQQMEDPVIMATWGYAGLPNSPEKFQWVLLVLSTVRASVENDSTDPADRGPFNLLYATAPGLTGAMLMNEFKEFQQLPKDGDPEKREAAKDMLLMHLDRETENWQQLSSIYMEDDLGMAAGRFDADLLPPAQEMDQIIRYETHLENQIERKLKQFYARRREPVSQDQEGSAPVRGRKPSDVASIVQGIREGME
jgi:hypothetical protein